MSREELQVQNKLRLTVESMTERELEILAGQRRVRELFQRYLDEAISMTEDAVELSPEAADNVRGWFGEVIRETALDYWKPFCITTDE